MTIYSYSRTSELEASLGKAELDAILEPEFLGIHTYCLGQRWYMTEALRDVNCSWGLEFHKRESGKRLMGILRPGDILLCSKLERVVSSSQEALRLIRKLKDKNVQLHIVELGADYEAGLASYAVFIGGFGVMVAFDVVLGGHYQHIDRAIVDAQFAALASLDVDVDLTERWLRLRKNRRPLHHACPPFGCSYLK